MRTAHYAALAAGAAGLLLAGCTTAAPAHAGTAHTGTAHTGAARAGAVQPAAAVPVTNDRGYHCVDLPRHHAKSCIVTKGFLYWADWAFVTALYWHPNPNPPDIVVTDVYFKAAAPGRQHGRPQEYNRTIVLADNVIVVNWDVTANTLHPPAPTQCMIDQGPQAGTIRACTPIEQRSVLDWWDNYTGQFPGWDW